MKNGRFLLTAITYITAEEGHDEVVSLRAGVNRAAHLWHPQANPIVSEHREGEAELVAIEGPLWFAYYNCVETAIGVGQGRQQPSSLRSALPWE